MPDLRHEMIEKIVALEPCPDYPRASIEALAKHWPLDVTPLQLLEGHAELLPGVPLSDVLWLARRLMPAEVTRPCARIAVLRACRVYTPAALDAAAAKLDAARVSHELREHSAALRALADDVSPEVLERAALAASLAASLAAAYATDYTTDAAAALAADYAARAAARTASAAAANAYARVADYGALYADSSAAYAAIAAMFAAAAADAAIAANTRAERSHQLTDLITAARAQ